jgi:hypothetical protein
MTCVCCSMGLENDPDLEPTCGVEDGYAPMADECEPLDDGWSTKRIPTGSLGGGFPAAILSRTTATARTMIPTRRSGSRRKCARAINGTQKKALPGSKFPVPPAAPCLKLSTEIPVGFLCAIVMPQFCDSGAGSRWRAV